MVVRGPPPFSLLIHLAFVVSLWNTFTFSPLAFVAAIEGNSFTDDHCNASEKCLPAKSFSAQW